jgi:hypothetical protein
MGLLMDRWDRWRHGAMKHGVREEQRRSEMVKPEIDGEQQGRRGN